ncbi:MAG: galactose-1-epimerase, partial [Moorea sp. SIO4G2]|nr:galactose-1-epimerase [Moorena sp. SIO4G2]
MGMTVLLVKADLYNRFNPEQSYATANNYQTKENKSITKIEFGQTKDAQKVYLYTLTNTNGLVAKITNYGATLTELHLPDNSGELDDVVLGFDSLEGYLTA